MTEYSASAIPQVADMFRLDGKVAVITGGGSGIGRLAAHVLSQVGASSIVTDRDGDRAAEVAAEIRNAGGHASSYHMDVADESSVVSTFAEIEAAQSRIDVLIGCAGISIRAQTEDLTLEDWEKVVAVNQTGIFLASREAGKRMLAQGEGSIVNISSKWGHVAGPFNGNLSYHATKAAVVNMTRALAVEWGNRGVRVNDIAPTFLRTAMTEHLFTQQGFVEQAMDLLPLRRTGVPADLAGALLYLASPASALVTGHSLVVDGGWTAR
ncbi:MAG: SDR family oxidoreductase [Rhodospirillaceae bacterium]|jgi:NAD(P)-dependent dehydrogenase (short-subunit alcohol dehydrogenase family)|nr:SDR family oxidoreductase [Rhodospirillaceae bacterium]MBT6139259.1 SDR family oxidoreductase [Rhodospirillaceae bacterium]